MSKKPDSRNPYSQTKAQWITRFDAQAIQEKAQGTAPKYDADVTEKALRKLSAFAASSDVNDVAVLELLASKGIDREYFSMFNQYEADLTALATAGAPDPRAETVISPADRQLIDEAHGVLSALRAAAGKAGESIGRVEDAKTVGRGTRVVLTAEGVIDGITHFLAGAKLSGPLLLDAGIGDDELHELEEYLMKLQKVAQAKEQRTGARESRTANIELKLLAVDSAVDLYRSRANTATRKARGLLDPALKPLPRAAERRKTHAPQPVEAGQASSPADSTGPAPANGAASPIVPSGKPAFA